MCLSLVKLEVYLLSAAASCKQAVALYANMLIMQAYYKPKVGCATPWMLSLDWGTHMCSLTHPRNTPS